MGATGARTADGNQLREAPRLGARPGPSPAPADPAKWGERGRPSSPPPFRSGARGPGTSGAPDAFQMWAWFPSPTWPLCSGRVGEEGSQGPTLPIKSLHHGPGPVSPPRRSRVPDQAVKTELNGLTVVEALVPPPPPPFWAPAAAPRAAGRVGRDTPHPGHAPRLSRPRHAPLEP